jgi:glutamate dehydrogenase/leucine dehydrogenase
MTKKFDERSQQQLLALMGYTGDEYQSQVSGATESDIVYSALDETMTSAVKSNWQFAVDNDMNFRDACLVNAINKIYKHYQECGISM